MIKNLFRLLASCSVLLMFLSFAESGNIDPKADQLLHQMSDLMAKASAFSFKTMETHDKHYADAQHPQIEISRTVILKRPDGLWMDGSGALGKKVSLWYDGKTLTLQSDKDRVYGSVDMPPTIDEAIDYAATNLDIPMPMADVFYSSPYDALVGASTKGGFVRMEKVGNEDCSLLAFEDDIVDWRIWIAQGDKALLCKLEITYKEEGRPKSVMTFTDWNFNPDINAGTFTHLPPKGYAAIPILGYPPEKTETPKAKETKQ